jgi:hypothetical protein
LRRLAAGVLCSIVAASAACSKSSRAPAATPPGGQSGTGGRAPATAGQTGGGTGGPPAATLPDTASESSGATPAPPSNRTPGFCPLPATAPAAPLPGDLRVLWTKAIGATDVGQGVAVSGDRIGVAGDRAMLLFDDKGTLIRRVATTDFTHAAAPAAGEGGLFYYAGVEAVALTGQGEVKWRAPLRSDDAHQSGPSSFVLSPDGVLYSAQDDGRLVALRAASGEVVWHKPLKADATNTTPTRVLTGLGDFLVVKGRQRAFQLVNRHTGADAKVVAPATDASDAVPLGAVAARGVFGFVIDHTPFARQPAFFDLDGSVSWADVAWKDAFPLFVEHRGRAVFLESNAQRTSWSLHEFDCGGPAGPAVAIGADKPRTVIEALLGADGRVFVFTHDPVTSGAPATAELLVLDRQFKPAGRRTFPDRRFVRGATIAPDGTLYALIRSESQDQTNELVAIATSSPGLAATPWPGGRGDSRNTGWTPAR